MRVKLFLIGALLLFHLSAVEVKSEGVFRYTDSEGQTHYVTDANRVPEQYREQVSSQVNLPTLGRSKSGQLYQPTSESNKKKPEPIGGGARKKIEVFVTSWCPHCRELEQFLTQKKIRFIRYDIERDEKGRAIYESLGGGGVPVSRIGAQVVRGFDAQKITQLLKK